MNRTATITLALPHGKPTLITCTTKVGQIALSRLLADTIKSYAARRGVAPQSIDYAVSYT